MGVSYHTSVIQKDGSLWTWGYNYYGQLGDNTTVNKSVPIQIGDAKWKQISAGASHTIGIQEDGSLWAWGYNVYGQLGDNTKVDKSIPTKIGTDKWKQISAGPNHTVGIQEDGTLWTWGYNYYGQLGDNTKVDKSIPIKIGDDKWKQISVGISHTVGLQEDGSLWVWGLNNYGQLGDNTKVNKLIPTKIGTAKWKQISAGPYHSIGIQEDGTLWTWGYNYYGQLGDNTTVDKLIPIKIGDDKWKQISAGNYHTLGIQEDGTLCAWGYNAYGQLGDNTKVDKSIPTKIGTDKWKQISAGIYHTLGIQEDGSLWAWGRNNYGQLGDNIAVTKLVPTKIDIDKAKILMDVILSITNKSFLLSSDGYKKLVQGSLEKLATYNNAVPTMTSTTVPSGTVQIGITETSGFESWKVFDKNDSTYVKLSATNATNVWIGYKFPVYKVIKGYTITIPSTVGTSLTGWSFRGQDTTTGTWSELHSASSQTWIANEKKTFYFLNTVAFDRYYIQGTSVSVNSGVVQIAEVELLEEVTPYISATPTSWQTVSLTLPALTQFEEEGMDDLSVLGRKVQTVMESPKAMTSEVLGEGKIYKTSVNLKKYFDLRKLEVK